MFLEMQAKIKIEPLIFLKNVTKTKDAYFCAIVWHQVLSKILCTYLFRFDYKLLLLIHINLHLVLPIIALLF
jgi:hypothetical protein